MEMKNTKTKLLFFVTLMVLVSEARGIEHLTINGEDVDSINLSLGESCTIEVVSSGGALPYILRLHTINFSISDLEVLEIKPEAGDGASVTPVGDTEYQLWAGTGMVAGVHFVFSYTATDTGQKEVELRYLSPPDPFDSIVINVTPASAGTAFTYQGNLSDGGSPANGQYDFEFKLYNDPNIAVGVQQGSTINKDEVEVADGFFTVKLDFGSSVFAGDARWLEISVHPGAETGAFTTLNPRQELTPTPYAMYALNGLWNANGNDIFNTNSGNVGIGTTSPSAILDVGAGAIRGSEDDVVIADTRGTGGRAGLELYTSTKSGAITYHPTEGMKLWVDGGGSWLSAVNVLPTGNVGIGKTNPDAKLEVDGGLKVTGAYKGNISSSSGSDGAPFPRPAYDSGWVAVALGSEVTLTHNIGGNVDNYVVDLQFKNTVLLFGVNTLGYGMLDVAGNWMGASYHELTTTSIKVFRADKDIYAPEVRVRIWVYN